MISRVSAVILSLLLAATAYAEPPPGADTTSPEAQWYRSLAQPGTGYGWLGFPP